MPSGIYTDKGTTDLRTLFLDHCEWQWLFGFENREGIFDIHRSFKFCPLVVQKTGTTQAIRAAFMHRNVDDWAQAERHVLAYPRDRVREFSPYSKAILEIRSEQDLRVLQKIYANGVLLGDKSERGWGVKYATEFHMTNDSKLFPPRPKWEAQGYQPDEYGHWLKGPWQPYAGPSNILDRPAGLVLSRDGSQALHVGGIEDVALPLYEGRMIGQFDFSEKGWVSGKGRSAVWEEIAFDQKCIRPQYLAGLEDVRESSKSNLNPKIAYMRIGSATNSRTAISSFMDVHPAGDSVFFFRPLKRSYTTSLMVSANLNGLAYDYQVRNRVGGLNLSEFIMVETSVIAPEVLRRPELVYAIARLSLCSTSHAPAWQALFEENPELRRVAQARGWRQSWAISRHERVRLRAIVDACIAHFYGMTEADLAFVLKDCHQSDADLNAAYSAGSLDPKGLWRAEKNLDPQLRHTILSLAAFRDLKRVGIDDFLAQNDQDGWQLPTALNVQALIEGEGAVDGLGSMVAALMGERHLPWQLGEAVDRSWEECAAHAELIRQVAPVEDVEEAIEQEGSMAEAQGGLF